MCRRVVTQVIHVNKRPVHNGNGFEEIGQYFTQIVAVFEWRNGREHNVHLHKKLVARVIGTQVLNLADGGGKAHGEVEQQVSLVGLGREPGQVADMLGGGAAPDNNHNEGEEETAGSVKPPNSAIEANWREAKKARVRNLEAICGGAKIDRHTQWKQNGAEVKYDISNGIVRSAKGMGQFDIIQKQHGE